MATVKVIWSGRSQAVRLPKEFQFDTDEVRIRRRGASLILEPIPKNWMWGETLGTTEPFAEGFVQSVHDDAGEQQRPAVDCSGEIPA